MNTINDRIAYIVEQSGLSKTAFADKINVSQQYISKLIRSGNPSNSTIADICDTFHVNREWLETGEGKIFYSVSRSDEIATFIGGVLSSDIDFRGRLIAALAKLTPDQWKLLEQVAENLMEEMQKEKPDH
ncbi:helix-turn-helix transcriptional regulator [Clostridia bacterium UC5.1-1D1]|jgi:transcriptional regulator with XRE-family HTH domain|uniref:helix-turn-helix domain-containing protein n=1 Tax=Agathobaculum massiliense TaxID=3014267 RepID=UPI0006C8294C